MTVSSFAERLEREGLVVVESASFVLNRNEQTLLSADLGNSKAKNISLAPDASLRGTNATAEERALLEILLRRFAVWSRDLLASLAPSYADDLEVGRTSFRPRAVGGAPISPRKDDRRLHVDAFASQPTAGRRILRVFANINPDGEDRVWQVGEPFEEYARRWTTKARSIFPGEAAVLQRLGITRGRRTPYDALMLQLHDFAKLDTAYQATAPRREVRFPPGAVWIVFTDSTAHAAIVGRYALEQTFYLPLSAMVAPEASPARILERITGQRLVPA